MEQNQTDNTSNVAMGTHVTHSDAAFTVDIIVLRSKMASEMTVIDRIRSSRHLYNYVREQKGNFPHKPGCKLYYAYYSLFKLVPSMQRSLNNNCHFEHYDTKHMFSYTIGE